MFSSPYPDFFSIWTRGKLQKIRHRAIWPNVYAERSAFHNVATACRRLCSTSVTAASLMETFIADFRGVVLLDLRKSSCLYCRY
ncbi:hypothetical protein CEXT_812031 [Caerostris extrusa]|uniref:Uncharacterized protein n=1 Tax=Caerostris extrusa TaxID=172846 RepID=A0AAV4Y9Y3_CAEEX|nr:hypothetical protein CEXT_812031 [Caerostris extrusa]